MHDPLVVRRFKRVGDLPRDRKRGGERHRSARNHRGERLALDELEDERRHAIRFLKPVDDGDVRMVQGGNDLCLALEARDRSGSPTKMSGRIN
jgi:hypothetical protein